MFIVNWLRQHVKQTATILIATAAVACVRLFVLSFDIPRVRLFDHSPTDPRGRDKKRQQKKQVLHEYLVLY